MLTAWKEFDLARFFYGDTWRTHYMMKNQQEMREGENSKSLWKYFQRCVNRESKNVLVDRMKNFLK